MLSLWNEFFLFYVVVEAINKEMFMTISVYDLPTCCRQVTDRLPIVRQLLADKQSTVGWQLPNRQPTNISFENCSSLLPEYFELHLVHQFITIRSRRKWKSSLQNRQISGAEHETWYTNVECDHECEVRVKKNPPVVTTIVYALPTVCLLVPLLRET